ncbi:MAG: hypothetical protein ACE5DW_06835 [Thermodesulfobacteriota bacterium]
MSDLATTVKDLAARLGRMEARLAELEGTPQPPTASEKKLFFRRMARASDPERKAMLRQWNREQEARRG